MRNLILTLVFLSGLSPARSQELFFYGVNSRPLEGEEEALIRKQLIRKSEKKILIYTGRRTDGAWKKERRESIRIRDNNRQVVLESGQDRLFPRKITRETLA